MKYKTVMNIFDSIDFTLRLIAVGFILKIMVGFSNAMGAWSELHRILQ
jgi:hypothetical protein